MHLPALVAGGNLRIHPSKGNCACPRPARRICAGQPQRLKHASPTLWVRRFVKSSPMRSTIEFTNIFGIKSDIDRLCSVNRSFDHNPRFFDHEGRSVRHAFFAPVGLVRPSRAATRAAAHRTKGQADRRRAARRPLAQHGLSPGKWRARSGHRSGLALPGGHRPGSTLLELLTEKDPALQTLEAREKSKRVRDPTAAEVKELEF